MVNQLSLKDQIYNRILEDILLRENKQSDILNEKKLVEKYGCSKTPVREALISLCNDGVLRNIPRYGYEILRITYDDIKDMLQMRYLLESGLLAANGDKITDNQIQQLLELNEKCNVSGNDVWENWTYNCDFHLKLVAFCGNEYAYQLDQKCMARLKLAYAQIYWDKWKDGFIPMDTSYHIGMIESIKKKDMGGAINYLWDDLNGFGGIKEILIPYSLKMEKVD